MRYPMVALFMVTVTVAVQEAAGQIPGEREASAAAAEAPFVPTATTAEGLYREGSRLSDEGRSAAAIQTWQALIEQFPDDNRAGCAAVCMGQLQLANRDHQGALKSLSLAAERFGHHKYGNEVEVGGYAYFYLASTYCEIEDYAKAAEALKALVANYPYAAGHRLGDALMSFRAKRWFDDKLTDNGMDLAFLDALIAEQKSPENFGRLSARQLYLVAHTLKDEKDAERAIAAFKTVVWKFPNESFSPYACRYAFQLQLEEKQYEGAMASARAMIERYPDAKIGKGGPLGAIGLYGVGTVHFAEENYRRAWEAFQALAEDQPTAADMDGVSLRALIAEKYAQRLADEGLVIVGLRD